MLFNSLSFALFLPAVLILYWILNKRKLLYQNTVLLAASYYFYAQWDWRFLFLLIFSTLLDYYSGLRIANAGSNKNRKIWLIISVVLNLGFLGFFKYYNFFVHSFSLMIQQFGFRPNLSTLNIILPVGISFYTFHGLSYVFDIYNRKITPTKNWINYSLFVSFFPLLVAGPIERATHLLPQIEQSRSFSYSKSVDGLRQIIWGLFKKIVIADNCAIYVNMIFGNPDAYSGSSLVIGAILFAFQIYGDFSGYSDIAIGTARLFGIELIQNFKFPYFSRDIAEFWRRWHISLSSWFRDYLYIPLGGSKGGNWLRIRNVFIIFLVSGFWHGANFTFIIWGLLHALYITPSILFRTNRNNLVIVAQGKLMPTLKETFEMLLTFGLTVFAWIFFRADSTGSAINYIRKICSPELFKIPSANTCSPILLFLLIFFIIIEWRGRENKYAIENIGVVRNRAIRWAFYSVLGWLILYWAILYSDISSRFIYFQF